MNTNSPRKSARITAGSTGFCFLDAIYHPAGVELDDHHPGTKPNAIAGREYNFRTGHRAKGEVARPSGLAQVENSPPKNFCLYNPAQGGTTVHT